MCFSDTRSGPLLVRSGVRKTHRAPFPVSEKHIGPLSSVRKAHRAPSSGVSPSTPQHSDSQPCIRPRWSRSLSGWSRSLEKPGFGSLGRSGVPFLLWFFTNDQPKNSVELFCFIFGLITFQFHFGKTRQPSIFMIYGFSDVYMTPKPILFNSGDTKIFFKPTRNPTSI